MEEYVESTWWLMESHPALHAVHVGVPGRVSGVDAASCKSVGFPEDNFSNWHLIVVCKPISAIYCSSVMYHPHNWRIN